MRMFIAKFITLITDSVATILRPFISEEKLLAYKPIHLCWWFIKHGYPIPKYFVAGMPAPGTVTTGSASNIDVTSFDMSASCTAGTNTTINERGFCYIVGSFGTPSIADSTVFDNTNASGGFSNTLSGLTADTSYRVRAYVVYGAGTAYGDTITVTTNPAVIEAPTVTTQAVIDIDFTTATGRGNVTSDGGATITERGVCWNTTGTPTTADSTATSAGTTGAFTTDITGLSSGTEYFVRAYAINSEGTSYGGQVSFTTLNNPPTVTHHLPTDAATVTTATPVFEFTGTDAEGDDITYQVDLFDEPTTTYLSESYATSNQSGEQSLASIGISSVAQSFRADVGNILSCRFYIRVTASATGNLSARLHPHSGTFGTSSVPETSGSTTIVLAESPTIAVSEVGTSFSMVEFVFNTPYYNSVADTPFVVSVRLFSGVVSQEVFVGLDNTSPTHPGNLSTFDSTVGWVADNTKDTIFEVYQGSAPVLSVLSDTDPGFENLDTPADTDPFNSGDRVRFTVQAGDALDDGTYYWRVRGRDPAGSDTWGDWSSTWSFTVDTSVAPEGSLVKVYVTDTWLEKPLKVYDGAEWQDATLKHYNGTGWDVI